MGSTTSHETICPWLTQTGSIDGNLRSEALRLLIFLAGTSVDDWRQNVVRALSCQNFCGIEIRYNTWNVEDDDISHLGFSHGNHGWCQTNYRGLGWDRGGHGSCRFFYNHIRQHVTQVILVGIDGGIADGR
jgi:hypothetical protein